MTVREVSEGSIRVQTLLTLMRLHEPSNSKASLGRGLSTASALPLASASASPELGGSSTLSLFLFLLAAGGGGGDAACEARVEPGESGPGLAIWLAYR